MNNKERMINKISGLVVLLISYVIAYMVGFIIFNLLVKKTPILVTILLCDLAATVSIYLIGLLYHSASVYDPYWSIQTAAIGISLMIYYEVSNLGLWLFLIFILVWSLRLTINFVITFDDITYIDWRYKMLKEKTGKLYPLVNLLGIHMFPTLIVYLASLPYFMYIINNLEFSFLDLFGYLIMILGVALELLSDIAMHKFKKFRKSNKDLINLGLWRHSRHPNYLGEITFWVGVGVVYFFRRPEEWYFLLGALAIYLMFMFISIPMAEKKMSTYKRNFEQYKRDHRILLPIPKR